MSDWLLYHLWGIRGYRVVGHEKVDEETAVMTLEPLPSVYRCPRCGSPAVSDMQTIAAFQIHPILGTRREGVSEPNGGFSRNRLLAVDDLTSG